MVAQDDDVIVRLAVGRQEEPLLPAVGAVPVPEHLTETIGFAAPCETDQDCVEVGHPQSGFELDQWKGSAQLEH
jgi:hypothetical protein